MTRAGLEASLISRWTVAVEIYFGSLSLIGCVGDRPGFKISLEKKNIRNNTVFINFSLVKQVFKANGSEE